MSMQKKRHEEAAALIIVVMTLVLMVTLAVGFMNIIGRQRGLSTGVALQTHADIALLQAQAHAIHTFVASLEETTNKSDQVVEYTNSLNAPWRRAFDAVIDTDGDFLTEHDRISVQPTSKTTLEPSTTLTSAHPMINTKIGLMDMIGQSAWERRHLRWHNMAYLSTDLSPVFIEPHLSEGQKVLLRKGSRYVVRYVVQALDANALLSINHNFPEILASGVSANPNGNTDDVVHYIRFQNYVRHFGRSIKSMAGGYRMNKTHKYDDKGLIQHRIQDRLDPNFTVFDPLDHESVAFNEVGESKFKSSGGYLGADLRLRLERGFRNDVLKYLPAEDTPRNKMNKLYMGPGHKGRIMTWLHMGELVAGTGRVPPIFTPFGDGVQDKDLRDPASNTPIGAVSSPWRVNLLSASNHVLRAMIGGLSSDIRPSTGKISNADLFGEQYPEPFPLAYDAGKHVPVFGEDRPYRGRTGEGRIIFPWTHHSKGMYNKYPANSYVMDIAIALAHAIMQARVAWVSEQSLSNKEFSDGNSHININTRSNDNEEMLNQVLLETYRILGEHKVYDGSTSLLSGDTVRVGSGSMYSTIVKDAALHPTDNTRSMEYVLNDWMISLFGKSNPSPGAYQVGADIVDDSIAFDFNSDGHVESTVTGWYDHEAQKRTWSWRWDGLGPYVNLKLENDYMKRPGWYRFVEGELTNGKLTPFRKVGNEWTPVPDIESFYTYNDIWLHPRGQYPIKPFTKTGRLFIGKSKMLYGFIRGEVYNLTEEKVAAASNRNFAYKLDPNNDGDYSDNVLLIQSEMKLINE